ncbi:MAG: hypothetical protein GXP27_14490 [Planctomycetes bacterium]|nr:hypothetical protein [Planctomycetota bacterium]
MTRRIRRGLSAWGWLAMVSQLVAVQCTAVALAAPKAKAPDSRGRATAVALNYCRAAFHRIRKYQSKRVLLEEQQKILNNLDLNGIDDEEVIRLYSAVLDEIGDIQIAEREQKFFKDQFRRTLNRRLTLSVFLAAGQVATGQFVSAVRTGVNSWWDYRDLGLRRDLDVWKVERQRIMALVDKSSAFLDTFWKLAKKRNIPDRWLVRGDDLDRLEEAVRESDPAVRLRILRRMERFMECYPPYWYHVARTQQALGQLMAASATYDRLVDLGAGHFRKDDMLAAALANQAIIQEYLQEPEAAETALEALQFSTGVWEANLMCAYVLMRHGRMDEAEDAILRNLDVGLEEEQSLLALLSLYLRTDNAAKLTARLADPETVRRIPIPFLLQCVGKIGLDRLPGPVRRHLADSLYAYPDLHFGPDDLVIVASPAWQLQNARISLQVNSGHYATARGTWNSDGWQFRFLGIMDLGSDLKPQWHLLTNATVLIHYPDLPVVRVQLERGGAASLSTPVPPQRSAWGPVPIRPIVRSRSQHVLRLTRVSMGQIDLSLVPETPTATDSPADSAMPSLDDAETSVLDRSINADPTHATDKIERPASLSGTVWPAAEEPMQRSTPTGDDFETVPIRKRGPTKARDLDAPPPPPIDEP